MSSPTLETLCIAFFRVADVVIVFCRDCHGSDHIPRVGPVQGDPAGRVMLENVLTRPDPTRDLSNTS